MRFINKKLEYLLFAIGIIFLLLIILEIFQIRINYRMFQKDCPYSDLSFYDKIRNVETGRKLEPCSRESIFIQRR